MNTCDLCDLHEERVRVLELPLRDYGGRLAFDGRVSTIKAYEDNSLVREAVAEDGRGRVLVIDGGGSMRRAMLGVACDLGQPYARAVPAEHRVA